MMLFATVASKGRKLTSDVLNVQLCIDAFKDTTVVMFSGNEANNKYHRNNNKCDGTRYEKILKCNPIIPESNSNNSNHIVITA